MLRVISLLILFFPLILFGKTKNFQVWNTDMLNIRIGRTLGLAGGTEFRYTDGGKKLTYKHYQGGLVFFHSPYMNIYTAYRQVYHRLDNKWRTESVPFVDLTLQGASRGRWFFSDRNRILYRIRGKAFNKHDLWVYRNRLFIMPSLRIGRDQMAPFFAYELFWEESHGINQNRIEGGLRIPYRQKTILDLSYMLRYIKDSQKKWRHENVLWIYFSLHF